MLNHWDSQNLFRIEVYNRVGFLHSPADKRMMGCYSHSCTLSIDHMAKQYTDYLVHLFQLVVEQLSEFIEIFG